jgi:transposase
MDRATFDSLDRETLIRLILSQAEMIERLTKRVAELEAKLNLPKKTPDNSSTPPSKGQKPSAPTTPDHADKTGKKRKSHEGAHRPLHPNPTTKRDIRSCACQHCGADVSQNPQFACEAYDHIDIPPIKPDVTRVTLHGGTCQDCGKKFKAAPPADMPKGSPFGGNLRALILYLRFTQNIALERLSTLLSTMLGLDVSEGAIINKVTYCFRSAWGAELYADIRSAIETGRRRAIDALEAIRLTLAGKPLAAPAPS